MSRWNKDKERWETRDGLYVLYPERGHWQPNDDEQRERTDLTLWGVVKGVTLLFPACWLILKIWGVL